jgi:diketogulonate reductase-like aldo/keto reductase
MARLFSPTSLLIDIFQNARFREAVRHSCRLLGISGSALARHFQSVTRVGETGVLPVVNQVELHPRFQQRALREAHARLGIATQAWSPLDQGGLLAEPAIVQIARRHGRSPAKVIIRWHLQAGTIVIPKSVTPARIVENGSVEDFTLTPEDIEAIDALDLEDGRIGPNPLTANFYACASQAA